MCACVCVCNMSGAVRAGNNGSGLASELSLLHPIVGNHQGSLCQARLPSLVHS